MSWFRDARGIALDRVLNVGQHARQIVTRGHPERYAHGTLAPVLLLPGVYETWQFLRPVAEHLNALGHPVHVLLELGYNRLTIVHSAALAQRYLQERDLDHVQLVGHSKGGLIGKHMMVNDDVDGRIDHLVAVSSPFGGSSLARYSPVRTLREFMPTHETVAGLAANRAVNARITSVYARKDPIIPGGIRLDGATNIELPLVGHFRPLTAPAFFQALDEAIGHGGQAR